MNGVIFDPIIAPPFICLIGLLMAAATVFVYLRTGARLNRWRNLTLLGLRLAATAAVLMLLLQPSRRQEVREHRSQKVLLVGVDRSRSMRQQDSGDRSRIDAAKKALRDSKLLQLQATPARLFSFDDDAVSVAPEALDDLQADGATTSIHRSIDTMLSSLGPSDRASALVLLTDGHDFQLVSPGRTAALAQAHHAPIYAVPLGDHGLVRDASIHIVSFEPYSFAKQKATISGSLRLIGCEHEQLTVHLLKGNQIVQTMHVDAGERREIPVDFTVIEPEAGQYEYEIRVEPLPKEADTRNNTAITFLNVIHQRIRVLLLEGAPYWDTTFLRRSLAQNDKVQMDAAIQYARDRVRFIRSGDKWLPPAANPSAQNEPPAVPANQEQFNAYDLIILGKSVDSLLDSDRYQMLVSFVKDHGGALVFGRGQAFNLPTGEDLDPVPWGNGARDRIRFQVGREGARLSPFRVLTENAGGVDGLPELLAAQRAAGDRKALSAMLAQARDPESGEESPAMVQRRIGRGQVLSLAVDGLWRWSFNPKEPATNNVFDRFWDQLVVWLIAESDSTPSRPYSFRVSTANLALGAKMSFRLAVRDPAQPSKQIPVTIYYEGKETARLALSPEPIDRGAAFVGEYLPEKVGRYRAVAALPGGDQEVKWAVFDENPEEKEVATDIAYLNALCQSTGGRVLLPEELGAFAELLARRDSTPSPKMRLTSLWDRAWIFYVIGGVFGFEWFFRRKSGLC